MRRKFQTAARTNDAPRKSLEFIVHAPLGKRETRRTTCYPKPFANGGCGVLVP
jgi:hypothetical protein